LCSIWILLVFFDPDTINLSALSGGQNGQISGIPSFSDKKKLPEMADPLHFPAPRNGNSDITAIS